ncbi:tigger transposable element-derived protein 1 [Nephila pilipes]|uniref:Tigger transposable element-derived protein 1 n=1 Tax=Nephila pilipes TaxID=299642 RepID=A0A8X6TNE8_NEPPI|nr:tigger transposable element-derived protein 1 [Nephila pilipes]
MPKTITNRKRKAISLEIKIKILDSLAKGEGSTSVGKSFGLNEATVRTIKRNEKSIRESIIGGSKLSSKITSYCRDTVLEKMEKCLVIWMEGLLQEGELADRYTVKQKALQIYKKLQESEPSSSAQATQGKKKEFSASEGWLTGFLKRNSFLTAPLPASKKDDIPLEPTVVIKEEPIEYEPDPADDECADAKDEFILPHEENELTSRDSPLHSVTEPSQQPSFPVPCMESETIEQPVVPTTSILGEQLRRKRKANPSKLSKPNQKVARSAALENSYVYDMSSSPLDNVDESSNPASLNDSRVNDHRHSSVDQFDVFGEYIAAKLRSLDRLSRVFAQKAIGDIIFEAEMGKFRGDEAPMTPSPTPSSSHM